MLVGWLMLLQETIGHYNSITAAQTPVNQLSRHQPNAKLPLTRIARGLFDHEEQQPFTNPPRIHTISGMENTCFQLVSEGNVQFINVRNRTEL